MDSPPAPDSEPAPAESTAQPAPARRASSRDTVESLAIAFIMALVVRAFAAEAYLIPTGSMAPTLMGRHKEVTCPECGAVYAVNAADEVEGGVSRFTTGRRIATGICVNCRYQSRVDGEPSFKGDRILVMKSLYDLPFLPATFGPNRWDVVVFRYPEEPELNYIKRLVGLPGETVRVRCGDLLVKPKGAKEFRHIRRSLEQQRAMQQMVFDDSHRARALANNPAWRRWVSASAGWKEDPYQDGTYVADSASDWVELRYRHVVLDVGQWRDVVENAPYTREAVPTLVTDFSSYNTGLTADHSDLNLDGDFRRDQESAWLQPHWVGDLTIAAHVDAQGGSGGIRLELIEGGVVNRCEFDLSDGAVEIRRAGVSLGRFPTVLRADGAHDIEFANVDNRLTLWVDGRPVFGDGLAYDDCPASHPVPTAEDLAPVRIAARGVSARVSGLVVKRDIYYTLHPGSIDYGEPWDAGVPQTPSELTTMLAEPTRVAAFMPLKWADFPVGEGRYLMFGDNSPRSKDSRGWGSLDRYVPADPLHGVAARGWDPSGRERWEVPRSLLSGKAFCVFWPHGKPFGPDIRPNPDVRLLFRPYFERMNWIH
jgi:signal peptidase I